MTTQQLNEKQPAQEPPVEDLSQYEQKFENVEQAGLHPLNRPGRLLGIAEGERDPHKTVRDLEDITGNPGHVNVSPYQGASINPVATGATSGPPSINEPPGSEVMPPPEEGSPEQQPGQPGPDAEWDYQTGTWRQEQRQDVRQAERQDYRQDARQDRPAEEQRKRRR